MGIKREPITYRDRSLGIIILMSAQLLIGVIHLLVGFLLLAFDVSLLQVTIVYDLYTVVFGFLTLVFAVYIWQGKKLGWIGTFAVSIFVSVANALTVLNLPSIPGIPKFAAPTEIVYSVVVMVYLLQSNVRKKYFG